MELRRAIKAWRHDSPLALMIDCSTCMPIEGGLHRGIDKEDWTTSNLA